MHMHIISPEEDKTDSCPNKMSRELPNSESPTILTVNDWWCGIFCFQIGFTTATDQLRSLMLYHIFGPGIPEDTICFNCTQHPIPQYTNTNLLAWNVKWGIPIIGYSIDIAIGSLQQTSHHFLMTPLAVAWTREILEVIIIPHCCTVTPAQRQIITGLIS